MDPEYADVRRRSTRDVLLLTDAARISAAIGFVVILALPWWTQTDSTVDRAGTYTGFGSLTAGSGGAGYAWLAVIGLVLALAAGWFRRWWLRLAGAGLAVLGAAATAIEPANLHGADFGHADDGTWVAVILLLVLAAADGADARLLRSAG